MSATDIATLLTAIFAAVAAGASWVSVLQTRKERIAERTPLMSIEPMAPMSSRQLRVQITNHGGPARGVQFAVALGNQWAYGTPPPTPVFLPGESRMIETAISIPDPEPQAFGFVSCYEVTGRVLHVWWTTGEDRVYHTADRPEEQVSPDQLMRLVNPTFDYSRATMLRYWRVEP